MYYNKNSKCNKTNCFCCKNMNALKNNSLKKGITIQGLYLSIQALIERINQMENVMFDASEELKENTIKSADKLETIKLGNIVSKCGICYENYSKSCGDHQIMIMICGHTICISCANKKEFIEKKQCPYCRKILHKNVIALYL